MKINWNRKYTTIAIYALLVIMAGVLFVLFVFRYENFRQTFSWFGDIAAPMIAGVAIAYVMNPLMSWLENKMFKKFKERPHKEKPEKAKSKADDEEKHDNPIVRIEKSRNWRRVFARVISLLLTVIIFLAALTGIVIAVVPNVSKSVVSLADNMGDYVGQVKDWVNNIFENNSEIAGVISDGAKDFNELVTKLAQILKPFAGNIPNFLGSLLVGLKNFLLGFIIAIYLLSSKERLMAQMKKIVCAFMRPTRAEGFLHVCSRSNYIFKQYVISNLVDALIIFVFMLVGMYAMGMPYPMLLAAICGVTNLIPFFGPFIGAIPCGILILLVDPTKVIWFGIFVLIIQQVDGNIIKPLLFGETMGLPAIWVLVSITIGGALAGVPGMLLGAPVFAVFYMLFAELVKKKLEKRNLPGETEVYEADSAVLAEDYLQNAEQPKAVPVSFEEATKPAPLPEEKDLPEPISETVRRKTGKRKRK